MTTETKRKPVCYFYDDMVGNFCYGPGHPMKPHRVRMTHELVKTYGINQHLDILVPPAIEERDLTQFHSNDYIDFLRTVDPSNMGYKSDEANRYNCTEDCPIFSGLYDYVAMYSAGSIGGAREVNLGNAQIAVNWAGGLHHGKKHEASGFCYTNDCVLGMLEFLRKHHRVLYIDIDIHHGDGVEEAFYTSERAMCVSFHKYGDYFPGTGALNDIGEGPGAGYSVNVPLSDGCDDETFKMLFKNVMDAVKESFDPQAVVLQCGADSLSGDRLGCFNLSLEGHGYAVRYIRDWGVPLLVLGGGGYTLRNVPKAWSWETGILIRQSPLEMQIPESCKYREYFGPDFSLNVRTSNMENLNPKSYCKEVIDTVRQNLKRVARTGGQISAQNANLGESDFEFRTGQDVDQTMDEHLDHPELDLMGPEQEQYHGPRGDIK